ncbi:hypothetical protein RUM43_014256 [Polyplax serrata]|uniref:Uncharacterized protein n=1 Tax=Polyplax serrata TaxID=468196 RepID=A0AAN8S6V1_POLSC
MTNWPNIQEYRNFEAKFFDNRNNPKVSVNCSATVVEDESVKEHELNPADWTVGRRSDDGKGSSPKRVRCIIKKDFDDSFKGLDRGDGLAVTQQHQCRSKQQETEAVTISDQSGVEKNRLQNHLKWKKQKEEEYLLKKEAEKTAKQKKQEAELRMEMIKKQKEKEREEKFKEWQEQKDREKEGKKREKIIMKVLEEELKVVAPVIDKEKLIENWVRLKDRQKQMEAEKKAEIARKEEESKALRQTKAALSYLQWKEKLKGKTVTLPKNGYQIFGPKPVPVVKEDWNNDFTSRSPRTKVIGLFNSKSNTSTSLSFRPNLKELENLSKDNFYLGDTKTRSSSFYKLKNSRSGLNICGGYDGAMPLKELQPGTLKQKKVYNYKEGLTDLTQDGNGESDEFSLRNNDIPDSLLYLPLNQDDQSRTFLMSHGKRYPRQVNEHSESNCAPIKKKIDLYINPPLGDIEGGFKTKKSTMNLKLREGKSKGNTSAQKSSSPVRNKSKPLRASSDAQILHRSAEVTKEKRIHVQPQNQSNRKNKVSRRSRSYDRPVKKNSKENVKAKGCTSSVSMMKVVESKERGSPSEKARMSQSQKRKTRKFPKPNTADRIVKKIEDVDVQDADGKNKKKLKKKGTPLSKSYSFTDSPYCAKKQGSKNKGRVLSQTKSTKDCEAKRDSTKRCGK